jgi:hypothetical protein
MQSSDMTAPTRANQGAFSNGLPEKRGIRFNPHVTVQGDPAAQWDITNGMKKLSLDDGGVAKDHARGGSSDSSADSAPIVTPVPGKEANDIHVGPTKKPPTFTPGAPFQAAGGPASQPRPANLPPGYPYRGPNAPVTLGARDEILQVDYNLQPRHFIPSSIASSPAASVHSQPQARTTGANATSPPAAGAAPFTPGLSMGNPAAFYGQPSAYNGAPGAPPVDPAAANEVAQRIINNALQQAALITGNAAGVPLNPALAATYANPQFMAGLYNPTLYGQAPSANPYYSAGPGMPDPAMAAALANAVATLPPAAFHAALQGFAGYGVPGATNPASPSAVGGPSANNRKLGLYKSELCRSWSETGSCRYGPKCQFAHGEEELRKLPAIPSTRQRSVALSGCPGPAPTASDAASSIPKYLAVLRRRMERLLLLPQLQLLLRDVLVHIAPTATPTSRPRCSLVSSVRSPQVGRLERLRPLRVQRARQLLALRPLLVRRLPLCELTLHPSTRPTTLRSRTRTPATPPCLLLACLSSVLTSAVDAVLPFLRLLAPTLGGTIPLLDSRSLAIIRYVYSVGGAVFR